jgi:hypothetical protein
VVGADVLGELGLAKLPQPLIEVIERTRRQLPRSAGHGYSVGLHAAPPGKTAIRRQEYPESSPGPMRASPADGQN